MPPGRFHLLKFFFAYRPKLSIFVKYADTHPDEPPYFSVRSAVDHLKNLCYSIANL